MELNFGASYLFIIICCLLGKAIVIFNWICVFILKTNERGDSITDDAEVNLVANNQLKLLNLTSKKLQKLIIYKLN